MRVVSYRSANSSPTALSYGTGLLYSLPQLLAEHWASHFDDTRLNQATARYGLIGEPPSRMALQFPHLHSAVGLSASSTGGALGTASMTSGAGTILSVIGT